MGVHTIVVTIHQGGFETSYTGPTKPTATLSSGPEILDIVNRLDDEIDVVVSGHTHAFTNALIPNAHGKQILVTQAFSFSTAYDDIDLLIDPVSKDVVSKTAQVVTTFGDAGPGLTPAADAQAITNAAFGKVAPLVTQVFGFANTPFSRTENAAGESTLGDLIADAQAEATATQLTFMNAGGIRADLDAGDITYNDLFTIQPFGNTLVTMNLTGGQIYQVLEQQFPGAFGQTTQRIMKTSGFHYTWDSTKPAGSKIVEVDIGGAAIDLNATYTVTCNNFMATGGDGFTTFVSGTNPVGGPVDLDALIAYVKAHTPFTAGTLDRITRL
jgi:5'-nucleotidase